ncbi:zinc-dependent alcohol dehydrogenase [Tuwongella immobilis]|uniref:Alcohol dehydrogenase-like C-terminal domain-containing protein n=1 Tax=Tuwongella immobilis TaxID=692036 RepID=A0A6C2YMZ1_9BACT|nr:zinc-binding dehydrogenase [Tuwongella immobilis]VIP02806.1 theronine dehydrogenase-like zn-dependent dehydrogenase : Theronine dehydrogenase-like Zn-dependent dehydrogenase OS=Opitutaceae bacterium TAV1 GN=OpiT1DRAFT_02295 PE=4 SV=1: ADH_N: ADH_zinc_N [Tuwongella immobilis]VTS02506.1 theronine dehydrogenase-like zn-dependent dehydrogenase : Theronine dehydrogenase-like Zn-dependent dehydrogenase OS=Opitutaceae bacterium TAV1 GN=OpiT1DRAFT_02295 PE=4 SV=1: ADH_N: ADH_zinc_N [Tuwongella immobil
MKARQATVVNPYEVEIREVTLPDPAPNQILVEAEATAISAGTELAVYTGTHQWLHDPNLPDWKFPFRSGYSAAGRIVAVGKDITGWQPGDRVSYPGNHASAELLTMGHERGRLWKLPEGLDGKKAALACIARYGLGASIRAGLTLGRTAAVLGLGIIGQFATRCLVAAGAYPVIGIDSVPMRRQAVTAGGAHHTIDPSVSDPLAKLTELLGTRGAEIIVDATGIPDAIPTAMRLACDAGQVIVVGSPRGRAREVNFYDDLHRRYIEVSGAHGNMLFEPAHTRLNGAWDINKAQKWLLGVLASGRLNLDGLVTHVIQPAAIQSAYEGLLKDKDNYLGVIVDWQA